MANVLAPKGFRVIGLTDGSPPNFGLAPGFCLYTTAIFSGDPLVIASGYLAPASVTGTTGAAVAGVAVDFTWNSIVMGRTVRANYYPGSDSVGNADVSVKYVNAKEALFEVQMVSNATGAAVGGPGVQADVGQFFNFATGTGDTLAQQSAFGLAFDSIQSTSTTLPFYLYKLEAAPRTDPTTAGNLVQVGFNNLTRSG